LWNQQIKTDRTIPDKPDIIIHDNEKRTCMLIGVAISRDRNVIKKETENILIEIQSHVECKNKGDTSNNRVDWDYFKVIQKVREQHTRKT